MPEPLLRVEMVTKRHGGQIAVDGVSLDLARGEFFALLGPSGCGKTTLLRLIAGFAVPDEGRILIDGIDMTETPPNRRPVNMMFQSYALFPHMNVAKNIGFGLVQEGLPKREIAKRVGAMLRLVQLEGFETRKPDQLSGGQKQRVALARALAKQPKLLLLDEPLTALDRRLREETQFELMHLQKTLGLTFLVVTHDQREAMAMAGRIGLMRSGRIEQMGSPEEIYERPVSTYVARFVGEINLLPGKVTGSGEVFQSIETDDGSLEVASTQPHAPGSPVSIAVRPERLILAASQAPSPSNALPGRIEEKAFLGDVTLFRIALASGQVLRAARQNAGFDAPKFEVGDKVQVGFSPQSALVLAR
jgi:putrescine transport system ATP-binding protein